ncbi:GNAT family N-acetyltransferase [Spirosoma montaniterrae]|uniref:Acetyltransferase n=1 Tax=Spirosoma montaniterrae TaxID=1178516 RepID=A0A1P9WUY9_9BACT|nr:GNAT family N-acetyltransferase [Spirosoma montaniterrae]AQG79205.1 acetyltransferase [Spirosoma montaniterrae]
MNLTDATVTDNRHHHRFELKLDGKLSIIQYQPVDDETLALLHTEVDPSLEGQGVGSHLVNGVLEYADRNGLKIVPLCPFVSAYLKRHPDWQRVVSTAYSVDDF